MTKEKLKLELRDLPLTKEKLKLELRDLPLTLRKPGEAY